MRTRSYLLIATFPFVAACVSLLPAYISIALKNMDAVVEGLHIYRAEIESDNKERTVLDDALMARLATFRIQAQVAENLYRDEYQSSDGPPRIYANSIVDGISECRKAIDGIKEHLTEAGSNGSADSAMQLTVSIATRTCATAAELIRDTQG